MRRLLIDVTPVIEALELTTKSVLGGELVGSYKSRFKGRGVEFEGYTDYTEQDDADLIDWKASTRSNKLLVKEYIEERNLRILFLIDCSNSMVYTTARKLKAEFAGEVAISLAFLMIKNADHVGFAMFNDRIVKSKQPEGGFTQYYALIDALLSPDNYGGGYNLNNAIKFTFTYTKPRTVVILLTDFLGPWSDWQDTIKTYSRKFELLVFMIRDPADFELPKTKSEVVLRDPFSNQRIHLAGKHIRDRYREYVKQQEKRLKDFFDGLGIGFLKLDSSKPFAEPIIEFFKMRKATWR
ncbi:DUF58 domain-containing protein [Candidatus Woesearchaeota archaeon]|nr:DUF58 domain-containing protein [Candidatus Woesearchaeota archaeon]